LQNFFISHVITAVKFQLCIFVSYDPLLEDGRFVIWIVCGRRQRRRLAGSSSVEVRRRRRRRCSLVVEARRSLPSVDVVVQVVWLWRERRRLCDRAAPTLRGTCSCASSSGVCPLRANTRL